MGVQTEQDCPFIGKIVQYAQDTPTSVFAVYHSAGVWTPVTLAEIWFRARQFTALVKAHGVGPEAIVMVVLRHGPDGSACFLGTMLAGAVPSFLPCPSIKQDPRLYWTQHRAVFLLTKPALVVACDDLVDQIRECAAGSGAVVVSQSAANTQQPEPWPVKLPGGTSTALLQHSSGTTGLKKGVRLSYGSIERQLVAYSGTLGVATFGSIASWLPLYHDMGLISSFLLPAWLGVPVISIDPLVWVAKPELLFDAIEQFSATHAWLPNFAFMHLVRRIPSNGRTYRLDRVEALINCSEPCKAATFDAFLDRFSAWGIRSEMLQVCYAMAETVFAVSQTSNRHPPRRMIVDQDSIEKSGKNKSAQVNKSTRVLLSNGPAIGECQVAILNDLAFLDDGEIGEVCIKSGFMFSGYHNNPDASKAAFHDGWFRTGDLGFLMDEEIFIVGRLKDIIIVNGKNLFAHDIEAAVSRVLGVRPGRCVAFGQHIESAGSEILVVLAEREVTSSASPTDSEIIRGINHAVIDEVGVACNDIRLVPEQWLVKTTSGKMSRAGNLQKYCSTILPT